MKALAILSMLALPLHAMATVDCREVWSVEAFGMDLGRSEELFSIDADGKFTAKSTLTPNGWASALGAPIIRREARGTLMGLDYRDEIKSSKGKTQSATWSRKTGVGFSRMETQADGATALRGDAPLAQADSRDADTLILPRLASLGWSGKKLRIFSMGANPTAAQTEQDAPRRFVVKSDMLTAIVMTDAIGNPLEFEIHDGKQTARSKRISGGCSNSSIINR